MNLKNNDFNQLGILCFLTIFLISLLYIIYLHREDVYCFLTKKRNIPVTYEKIENIHLEKRAVLLNDLSNRLGVKVTHCKIHDIDFLKDTAELTVYYNK